MEIQTASNERTIHEMHSYDCNAEDGGVCNFLQNTPTKAQPAKKLKNTSSPTEPSLIEVQNTIIEILSGKINERADQLESMVKKNSAEIENVSEALNSIRNDVIDLRKESDKLKTENAELKKKMTTMEERIIEQERYSRRSCLRLYGVAENPAKNVKLKAREICKAVVSVKDKHDAYRLGRLKTGEGRDVRPRPIIIRFVSRTLRDLTWKSANQNDFLKSKGYSFKEDLTASDREARSCLWSAVEKARKEGKSAYFSGARAFIEGKELHPDGKGK